ncbi:MAG: ABC transporter permease subunit [Candidatus Sumerlaeia bacterium]|nr:ABC transporter permease subunit [Candidatus Sumerlaeia bacterium]
MDRLGKLTPCWVRALPWLWLAAVLVLLAPLALGLGGGAEVDGPSLASPQRLARLGWNSLRLAGGAVVLAMLLAVPVAVTATRLGRGRLLLALACLPLFIPPTVLAVAAVRLLGPAGMLTRLIAGQEYVFPVTEQLLGPPSALPGAPIYTLWGGALVLAWGYAPLAVLALVAVLRRAGVDAEEHALLHTGPLGVLARVTLPMAAGGALAGGALVFLFALTDLAVPEALRSLPVLVAEVYVQFGVYFDTRAALMACGVLAVLAGGAAGLAGWLATRTGLGGADTETEDPTPVRLPTTAGTRMVKGSGWVLGVVPVAAAVFVLVWTATGPEGPAAVWRIVWSTARDEFFFTLALGGLLAVLAAGVGGLVGWALAAARRPAAWRVVVLVPLVLPAPVLAVGMQVLLRRPPGSLPLGLDDGLAALSQTHAPLLAVWLLRFAPVVALLVERALRRVGPETLAAAALDGAGTCATARWLLLPACWPALAGGALATFAFTLGEVGAAVLLLPPGTTTLGVRLLTLMHFAPTGQVSALCLLLLVPGALAYAACVGVLAAGRAFKSASLPSAAGAERAPRSARPR